MADLTQHWRKTYENKYLGAWDLWIPKQGRYAEASAKIVRVHDAEVIGEGGRKSRPWQLDLIGVKTGKPLPTMIVSKTSGTTLQLMFGPSPQDWNGHEITLYVRKEKKVRKGSGDVLTIRNTRGSQDLREELQQRVEVDSGELEDDMPPGRDPGQEG